MTTTGQELPTDEALIFRTTRSLGWITLGILSESQRSIASSNSHSRKHHLSRSPGPLCINETSAELPTAALAHTPTLPTIRSASNLASRRRHPRRVFDTTRVFRRNERKTSNRHTGGKREERYHLSGSLSRTNFQNRRRRCIFDSGLATPANNAAQLRDVAGANLNAAAGSFVAFASSIPDPS
ncbi:hypothetical protein HYPSUDRAFT_575749 [Hypholoma sublateritium FD-334 SS-4]|uniref:Uncharacterized protein n=1 Tax=Hypholoma sublateritium (strain FD-334 SS-4) TaxID=945553 RepID=A0A0D2KFU3_HYPSF|nr:hypothetical protein HYPSUDRAFT_575749 [Hypholoma sublateritium FD-334 SS-4]